MTCHSSPSVRNEQISLSPDGFDALCAIDFIAELPAQMRYANVQHSINPIVFASVELLKQRFARLDLPGVQRQAQKQIELIAGQRNQLTVETDRARSGID